MTLYTETHDLKGKEYIYCIARTTPLKTVRIKLSGATDIVIPWGTTSLGFTDYNGTMLFYTSGHAGKGLQETKLPSSDMPLLKSKIEELVKTHPSSDLSEKTITT
jgi:hypothetical protein